MRHQIVTRIVLSLAALFVAAASLFAWAVTRQDAPAVEVVADGAAPALPAGSVLFDRQCAMCHDAADTGHAYRDAADREAAAEAFRRFLTDHYAPSAEEAGRIVEHVLTTDPP